MALFHIAKLCETIKPPAMRVVEIASAFKKRPSVIVCHGGISLEHAKIVRMKLKEVVRQSPVKWRNIYKDRLRDTELYLMECR